MSTSLLIEVLDYIIQIWKIQPKKKFFIETIFFFLLNFTKSFDQGDWFHILSCPLTYGELMNNLISNLMNIGRYSYYLFLYPLEFT